MKKYIIIGGLIAVLGLSGCGQEPATIDESNSGVPKDVEVVEVTPEPEVNEETQVPTQGDSEGDLNEQVDVVEDMRPPLVIGFDQLLDGKHSAMDVVTFMEEHKHEASIGEMEYLLAYLMKFQTAYIEQGYEKLYEPVYMEALNDVMDGVLEPSLIEEIEDLEVRNFYNALDKSYLTIVRYEETPVIEMDWDKLADLGLLYSKGLNKVIAYRSYLESIDFNDYYSLSERIVTLEQLFNKEESSFVKAQLRDLIADWSSYLIVGPEGSFIDYYIIKDSPVYTEMVRFGEDYSSTEFGRVVTQLTQEDMKDFYDVSSIYDRYIEGLVIGSYRWQYSTIEASNNRYIQYDNSFDAKKSERINLLIDETIQELIAPIEDNVSYQLDCFLQFDDGKRATIYISLGYQSSETERVYEHVALNIDLETGKQLTLADYFNQSSEDALATINRLGQTDYSQLPNFEFVETGLIFRAVKEDIGTSKYSNLTFNQLVPFSQLVDYQELPMERYHQNAQNTTVINLEEFLESEMSLMDYVDFMEENIERVDTEEAEKMLEALIAFQSAAIEEWGDRVDELAFSDDTESDDYQEFMEVIERGYLKIDYDEDYAYLTLDWSQLEKFASSFSEAMAYVIEKRSNRDYFSLEDHYSLAKDTIRLEVMEDKVSSPFVRRQMEALYDDICRYLIAGPVGNYYDFYAMRTGDLYEEMVRFGENYSTSALGRFLIELNSIEDISYEQVANHLNAFNMSDNLGPGKWTPKSMIEDKNSVSYFSYHEIGNSEKSDVVNETMDNLITEMINYLTIESSEASQYYEIKVFPIYYTAHYVSLYMSGYYYEEENVKESFNRRVSINMETGKQVTLDKYLNIYPEQSIAIANNLLGTDYTVMPGVLVLRNGIRLEKDMNDPFEGSDGFINKRQLVPYIGLDNL